ncbi:PAS domain S-box protein [Rudanella paleaurantiibacter]|uniref:Sensory/regulatory protein RpfC n=1 Tax=Rudanella paleaurantiibacter TaxID=2614655 RepID=A0A7J5TUA0_9BACT|nr:PAS domain-containing hybrid sensor histidine kinase/response regulator [Rudanella paleaurantiibacter]KAB7727588.1 PAS domain S-box protein [Rudanella paleaurantiibacter]
MNYHKMLAKQVSKYLPDDLRDNPALAKFLDVVNQSYKTLNRDRERAERAFSISEEEYVELNNKLKHEITVRKQSVEQLREAVNAISEVELQPDSDDLLTIARLLYQQVSKRKSAEEVFISLIANMRSGILLEDENRKIVYCNQGFCNLFGIPLNPEQMPGIDCSNTAEQTKDLFRNPDEFVKNISHILQNKQLVTGEILELANGTIFQRDYIPIYIDQRYKGHLWSYTDITERKKAQDALEQSELKNRLIMNGALDAIITIDMTGAITFWNPQAEKIFGWQAHEVIGAQLAERIIPEVHRAAHNRGMARYQSTQKGPVLGKQMELEAVNRNGEHFPIELYIIPVKQGDDEFFCSFIRDISERKKNEAQLEGLSLVASANKNGIVFADLNGRITWANEGLSRITGYSNAEILAEHPACLLRGPLTDPIALKRLQNLFKLDEPYTGELIFYRKDGSWFWGRAHSQPVVGKDGAISHYFAMLEDISEEKVAQRKVKEYEERLKMALTNVGDNYWEHDFRTGVTSFSNPDNAMLGFSMDQHDDLASLWWSRIHPDDRYILQQNDENYKKGLINNHHYEYRMIHQNGSVHWVLDRGVVTETSDEGKPLKIIGTHVDITRQKKLELELTQAKVAAEESTKAKELFLANMSHEIRTPMNAIMGMANQLNKTALNSEQQFFVNTIQSATDHLLIIINDILDLSKIEARQLTLEKIGFEPKLVVGQVMQVLMHKAEEKGLSLVNSFCDDQLWPVLLGDPYRLNQILLNLISNAIKFTEKGGVDINCRVVSDDETQQTIRVTVKDTGIGMDQSFVKSLFKKFQQEDESVTRRFGGTGLGMSICKHLVELMEGTIEVESQKGVGTTVSFMVSFQKGTEDQLPVKEPGFTNVEILAGKRILVADDNEMNRLVASTILRTYGALIEEAQNGQEALEKLKVKPVDLVLMDVQMPVMDGVEATQAIRQQISAQLPVIALTALAVKGDSEKFIAAGMSDYLSKPFEETQLLSVVGKWIDKQKADPQRTEADIPPLYNLTTLETIARGNNAFVHKMIDLFIQHVPASVAEIKEAYANRDFERVAKTAHRIKPSIDNLGVASLKEPIREIEKKATVYQTSAQLETLLTRLDKIVNRVVIQLQALQQ